MNDLKLDCLLKGSLSMMGLILMNFFTSFWEGRIQNYHDTRCSFQFRMAPDGCKNNVFEWATL